MTSESMSGFPFVVQTLTDLRAHVVAQLRDPAARRDALKKKLEIDRALAVLAQATDLALSGGEESLILPNCRTPTPSSEYRVIEDNETELREHWTEVAVGGKRIRLQPGDVVLRRK